MVKVKYQMTVRVSDRQTGKLIGVFGCVKTSQLASIPRKGELVGFDCCDDAEVERLFHCDGADWTNVWLVVNVIASGIDEVIQQLRLGGFEEED